MADRLLKLNQIMRGQINYYGLANAKGTRLMDKKKTKNLHMETIEKISTKQRNLVRLGINKYKAWEYADSEDGRFRIGSSWWEEGVRTLDKFARGNYQ